MDLQGRVQNGVVVLNGGLVLPEGAAVVVSYSPPKEPAAPQRPRVEIPLVRSASQGSLHLTSERIAEVLEDDDVSS